MRTQAAYWRILILDPTGMMVDIPEADVESVDFEDIVNGGSGTGTLVLRRDIYNAGAIDHDYTVMIFMWDAHYSQPLPPQSIPPPPPVDPYYVGHVVDIDQEELITHGRITFSIEGDATMLADGIVTESINPGAAYGNPDLPAQDYLLHVITTYLPDGSLDLDDECLAALDLVRVAGLGGRQQMAHWADAADPWRDARHFPKRPPFAEFLETPELDDMKFGVGDVAGVVQKDADFSVAFDSGHRVDEDAFWHVADFGLGAQPNFSKAPWSLGSEPERMAQRTALIRSAGGGQPGTK